MEFTDIDKKNIEKMYKKYGEKLVSKIVKKQDKLKKSESLRSTVRKMRQKGGGEYTFQSCAGHMQKCKYNYCASKNSDYCINKPYFKNECKKRTKSGLGCKEWGKKEVDDYVLRENHKKECERKEDDYSCGLSNLDENDFIESFTIYLESYDVKELNGIQFNEINKKFTEILEDYFNKKILNSEEPSILKEKLKNILGNEVSIIELKDEPKIKFRLIFPKLFNAFSNKTTEGIRGKISIQKSLDNFLEKINFDKHYGIYREFKNYIKTLGKKFPPGTNNVSEIKIHLKKYDILVKFLKEKKPELVDINNEYLDNPNLEKLYSRLLKSLVEKENSDLYQSYPIQNDQTMYQENPDSEENLSLKYNPNFQPMQQLPVAVQPVAVKPVAVQPVAVQPVGVQPVAVQQPVILK